jgi:hypothetical protein
MVGEIYCDCELKEKDGDSGCNQRSMCLKPPDFNVIGGLILLQYVTELHTSYLA